MKKLLLSVILFGSLGLIHADDPSQQVIGPFGTLNNRDNSAAIADNMSQDLLNVDITPGGKSFKKRKGYGQAFALTVATSPVHGTYEFFDSNGNDIALAANDTYLMASIAGASPTVLFSNGPLAATYQCTDSQGFAYCANSARTQIVKTNGVTTASLVVVTTGTMVAVTPDRLVQSGFTSFPNRIDFSASNDFTSWTTGVAATSAFQFTVTAPGSGIKHIAYAFNRIMWFKDSSFGYILPGATPSDWVIKTISPVVGTLDNSSVYWQDTLYFKGQDGHIYSYDGTSLQKISKEISGTIAQVQKRATNSWSQSTAADFNSGSLLPSNYIDTNTTVGSIQLTFPDYFTVLRTTANANYSGKVVWSTACYNTNPSLASGTTVSAGAELDLYHSGGVSADRTVIRTLNTFADFRPGTIFHFRINHLTTTSSPAPILRLAIAQTAPPTGDPTGAIGQQFYMEFKSTAAGLATMNNSSDGAGNPITISTSIAMPFNFDLYLSTSNYSYSINGQLAKSGTNNLSFAGFQPYVYMILINATGLPANAGIGNFGVYPETATYMSAVKNGSSLTSWDTLNVTSQNNGGLNTFYLRSSTNSFAVTDPTPTWQSVSAGAVPSISTGTYFQFRDDFSINTATGISPKLDEFTINWIEGNASDKTYATYFNDSILFAVTYGAATTNNRILKYDLLNQGWLIYDLASNGFYLKNLSLYFGSANGGYVYKYGDVDNDNGSAINAYWKSKDFIGGDPFRNEEMRNISVYGSAVANSSVTVTYALNESTSTSYIIPTYRSGATFFNSNRSLPVGIVTNSFNVKIGNNAADQPFEILAERVGLNPKPWNPTSQ